MDRYDEKAAEILYDPWGRGVAKDVVDLVAAFGRECAAEAYEDAATIASYGADYSALLRSHVKEMKAKAAALRSTPTTDKKEGA